MCGGRPGPDRAKSGDRLAVAHDDEGLASRLEYPTTAVRRTRTLEPAKRARP